MHIGLKLIAIVMLFSTTQPAHAAASLPPETGISHELALDRAARITDLHYALDFTLTPHAAAMPGHELLRFHLADGGQANDLQLDFRDGAVTSAKLNDTSIPTTLSAGHLVLPAAQLHAGDNIVDIAFTARIAAAGAAITRYEDKEDSSEYVYSLFVPMDASMAFPCFDQPDLKARFKLNVDTPLDMERWVVISNAFGSTSVNGQTAHHSFLETQPISTYLFAFAAGPWTKVHPTPNQPDVYVRRSQLKRAEPEVPQLQAITARGMAWLADYFQQPFPFPKYDIVLIPGFPFGGMEHAGATFLREDSVLFRSAPTASDRFGRDILTLHELTHQWFGDLVTMRWFDDLWLKEGFAQYMAYRCLDSLDPQAGAWKHFYEDIKPLAYGIDETEGTTPIFQNIPNLKDAKSAYGAIVYQKAPAILKQLEFRLGAEAFRNGLRLYLKQHAYANAQWADLIEAFHTSSGQDVRAWADAWVLRRGMPEVSVTWSCSAGKIHAFALHQHDVLPDKYVWPIATEVLLQYPGSGRMGMGIRADFKASDEPLPSLTGKPCPDYVFANSGDQAYGRFLLDPKSEAAVREQIEKHALHADSTDPLLRSQLWGALWDNVHVAASAPRNYVDLVLTSLPKESDETLARIEGGHATTALERYMSAAARAPLTPKLEAIATDRMLHAPTVGLRIISFRTLTGIAATPAALTTLKELLAAKLTIPGVDLRPQDRWNLVARLIAMNDPGAPLLFAAEAAHDKSGDAEKFAFAALAGTPRAEAKKEYFAQYVLPPADPKARPEDWLTQSLRPFNAWNQSALTEPFLRRALDQLPQIKRDRKIFFLGAWLGAFLGGQQTPTAQATVKAWLDQPNTDADLRLKVLEASDELNRTVRIRQRFPD